MSVNQEIWSDLAIHPGETLADVIDEHDLSPSQLAEKSRLSRQVVCDIIAGTQDITTDIAQALERVFGVPARFWLNMQSRYEKTLARNAAKSD